uniref:Dynein regulatory complex subunit 2 n=2 Tax=Gouania willdenowi TaxID=441366 RepID=A0A8C5HQV1_GOUWI
MPKKKEKGAGKSEEERLLRAQVEQEVKRAREETLAQFLKNKVQAEQRNSTVNRQKLNDSWREILRQCREAELRTELVELQHGSARQLDELNSVMENLVQEVEQSERKTEQMQRAHQQHMESFWGQQNLQLVKLQQLWLHFLRDRNSTLTAERKHVLDESQRLRGKLDDLKLSAEQRDEDEMDELHRLNVEMLQSYESTQQMSVWGKGLDGTDKHLNDLGAEEEEEERKNNLLAKKEKLKKTMEILERQKVLAQRLKGNQGSAMKDMSEEDLTSSISEVKVKHQQLQAHLRHSRKSAKEELTRICVRGHQASKRLQVVIDKEEKILRVAEMCKKLESQ